MTVTTNRQPLSGSSLPPAANLAQLQICLQKFRSVQGLNPEEVGDEVS
jgi:hypothetical protein